MSGRTLFIEHNGPVPNISAQLGPVAGILGVQQADINEIDAITLIHRFFINTAVRFTVMTGKPSPQDEFDAVVASAGFDNDALWDVIFSRGPSGVAVAEILVAELFTSGKAAELVAESLRDNGGITPHRQVRQPEGEPQGDLHNLHQAMVNLGLYHVVYGPGNPQDLSAAIGAVAPEIMSPQGDMILGEGSIVRWMTFASPEGAAAVFIPVIPTDQSQMPLVRLVDKLSTMAEQWTVAPGKPDAFVPEACAAIMNTGSPLFTYMLDAVAPSPVREYRQALRRSLLEDGFQEATAALLKGTMRGVGERSQLLWAWLGEHVILMSPVVEGVTGELPEHLRAMDFGRYELTEMAPFGVLKLELPYPADIEVVWQEAQALAEYADACEMQFDPSGGDLL